MFVLRFNLADYSLSGFFLSFHKMNELDIMFITLVKNIFLLTAKYLDENVTTIYQDIAR